MRRFTGRGGLVAVAIAALAAFSGAPAHGDPTEDTIDVARVAVDRTIETYNTVADSLTLAPPVSPIMGKIIISKGPGDRAPKALVKYAFEQSMGKWDCYGSYSPGVPVIVVCEPLTKEDWRCVNVVSAEATSAAGEVRGQLDCDGRFPWSTSTSTVRGTDPVTKDVEFGQFGLPAQRVVCIADNGASGEPTPGYIVTCGG